jgi:NitT/TauT family transport system ATP-binding protein
MVSLSGIAFDRTHNGQPTPILADISLSVGNGEVMALFGPNGCGKSTLLNIVAGLETANVGTVTIGGKPVDDSKIGFVFQNYQESLFPWLTVRDNVAFPLEAEGLSKADARRAADEILMLVRLDASADRFPYELSGGMRQLVAICRAMVVKPDVLLRRAVQCARFCHDQAR